MSIRESARGIVFNAQGQLMLLRCEDSAPADPRNAHILRYWVTPGGGKAEGESLETALARELREESGLLGVEIGPCAWTRELELVLPQRGLVMCHERYFLCRSQQDNDVARAQMTEGERDIIKEIRWWSLDEMASSNEVFRPEGLVGLVRQLVRDGAPPAPIRIEQ